MSESEIGDVVKAWKRVWEESGEEYVQIFENRGAMMVRLVLRSRFIGLEIRADAPFSRSVVSQGASNPHPHGQIWSLSYIPTEPSLVYSSLQEYAQQHDGRNLLLDYAQEETKVGKRT
jgi:UDPglucose--hexose-1-phosphate uridylyltransferase